MIQISDQLHFVNYLFSIPLQSHGKVKTNTFVQSAVMNSAENIGKYLFS